MDPRSWRLPPSAAALAMTTGIAILVVAGCGGSPDTSAYSPQSSARALTRTPSSAAAQLGQGVARAHVTDDGKLHTLTLLTSGSPGTINVFWNHAAVGGLPATGTALGVNVRWSTTIRTELLSDMSFVVQRRANSSGSITCTIKEGSTILVTATNQSPRDSVGCIY